KFASTAQPRTRVIICSADRLPVRRAASPPACPFRSPGPDRSASGTNQELSMSALHALGHALGLSFGMLWQILWALVLGFALSGAVEAVVSKEQMSRLLPD